MSPGRTVYGKGYIIFKEDSNMAHDDVQVVLTEEERRQLMWAILNVDMKHLNEKEIRGILNLIRKLGLADLVRRSERAGHETNDKLFGRQPKQIGAVIDPEAASQEADLELVGCSSASVLPPPIESPSAVKKGYVDAKEA